MQPLRSNDNTQGGASKPAQGQPAPAQQGNASQGVPRTTGGAPSLSYNTVGHSALPATPGHPVGQGAAYSPYARPVNQWDLGGAPMGPRSYTVGGPYDGPYDDPYARRASYAPVAGPYDRFDPYDRFGPPHPPRHPFDDPYYGESPIRHHVQGLIDHILAGKAYEAFEKYYAENCVMSENGEDPRVGKSECRKYEQEFLGSIERWNDVRVGSVSVDGNKSAVEWTFDLSFYGGKRVVRRQVAIQTWAKGKIVEEVFYHA
eukprot:TRINITY_DN13629_c0_g1_i1.p1 TRINITY_DN13629_c0_g1~~TRINITY_DN13629_c0_g1_i1.p1  ORF type:complete len:259 (-),score=44.08 TRINITY_DN13629_c0_g1_i1:231-1007(-)